MPFFDFLEDIVGTVNDAGKRLRRKTDEPTVEFNRQLPITSDVPLQGPRQFKGMIPEGQSNFLQEQNRKAAELKNRALELVRKNLPPQSPGSPAQRILAQIQSADVKTTKNIAELVKQALTRQGMGPEGDPEFEQLKRDNDDFNRMVYKSPVEVTGIAVDPAKLQEAQKALETIRENALTASTETDREMWRQQAADQEKLVKMYEQRDKAKKAETAAAAPPQLDPEIENQRAAKLKADEEQAKKTLALTGNDGTPGKDSIFEPLEAISGNGRKEFANQAKRALEKIGQVIPFTDPFQKVAFYVALPAYAEAMGEETFNRVIRPFSGIDKEAESFRKRAREEQVRHEDAATESSNEIKAKQEEVKRIMGEIGNLDVMNTPLGVVGFILTSLVLGPRMSAFLFSRSASRGKLEGDLKLVLGDIKGLRDREASHFRMGEEANSRALEGAFGFGRMKAQAGEERASTFQSKMLDHRNRLQEIRAMRTGKEDDPEVKTLADAYERKEGVSRRAEAKIARSERKIADLRDRLSDNLTSKQIVPTLQKALAGETALLNKYETERDAADADLEKIDQYLRNYSGSRPRASSGAGRE